MDHGYFIRHCEATQESSALSLASRRPILSPQESFLFTCAGALNYFGRP
jgi:hypothetical protein